MQLEAADWSIQATPPVHLQGFTPTFVTFSTGVDTGCCTILAAPLLSAWYGWPEGFTRFVGAVNISYGCYSGLLALRLHRKARLARWTVFILIAANTMWAAQCFTQVWWLGGDASYLGRAHLIFEGLFVGGLAYVETRIVLPYAK